MMSALPRWQGKYGPDAAEAGQRKDLELKFAGAWREVRVRVCLQLQLRGCLQRTAACGGCHGSARAVGAQLSALAAPDAMACVWACRRPRRDDPDRARAPR